jgi:hypothetical protein
MKEILHKISSISMALLVLFSSFSFTVHKHMCGNEVADVSYIIEADSCGMEMDVCKNNNSSEQNIEKEPCCKNISEVVEGNQNEQQALQGLEIQQVQFVAAFINSYVSLFDEAKTVIFYNDYPPPLIVKNIYKLDEVYLI